MQDTTELINFYSPYINNWITDEEIDLSIFYQYCTKYGSPFKIPNGKTQLYAAEFITIFQNLALLLAFGPGTHQNVQTMKTILHNFIKVLKHKVLSFSSSSELYFTPVISDDVQEYYWEETSFNRITFFSADLPAFCLKCTHSDAVNLFFEPGYLQEQIQWFKENILNRLMEYVNHLGIRPMAEVTDNQIRFKAEIDNSLVFFLLKLVIIGIMNISAPAAVANYYQENAPYVIKNTKKEEIRNH